MKVHAPVRGSGKSAIAARKDTDGVAPRPPVVPAPQSAPRGAPHDLSRMALTRGDGTADAPVHAGTRPPNRTGLPDGLKAGLEHLSNFAMDDVRVHYNSPKPAQLQAHAYTQGADIHVGPGQERHLPHEAWHVAQQKQSRVKPTLQMNGVAINDDGALEREADRMGSRASQAWPQASATVQRQAVKVSAAASLGNGSHKVTAAHDGRTAGSVKLHDRGGGTIEVTDLGVDALHRGSGIGQGLLGSALRTGLGLGGKNVRLDADDKGSSGRLINWYQQMGFSRIGTNERGQASLEAPIGKVLGAVTQRRMARPITRREAITQLSAASSTPMATAAPPVASVSEEDVRIYMAQNPPASSSINNYIDQVKRNLPGLKPKDPKLKELARELHSKSFIGASASAVLSTDAITNNNLDSKQKSEIIEKAKKLIGKTGTASTHGEGVGKWKATGISIQQSLQFDARQLAWTGDIHYDFTGEPHGRTGTGGGVPTPHVQFVYLRAAGSQRPYPIRDHARLLTWSEIQALLVHPETCPPDVWDWVVAYVSNSVGDKTVAAEREHIFK
jgi:ribosomal protein S18 acetylase RimI-like enzyme